MTTPTRGTTFPSDGRRWRYWANGDGERHRVVTTRKSGLWMYYSIAPAESEFHRKLLDCLTACFADVPELKKDATRAKKVRKDGGAAARPERDTTFG